MTFKVFSQAMKAATVELKRTQQRNQEELLEDYVCASEVKENKELLTLLTL
jgi:hypothetical protein